MTSCGVHVNKAAVENGDQRALLKDLLDKNADVFSQHPMDYSHTTTVQHEIPLVDPRPFQMPYRKIPPLQVARCEAVIDGDSRSHLPQ